MKVFKADLHTHTVLSPCGSLEMSPKNIVEKAISEGIDLLGITDHNTTLMCRIMQKVAGDKNLAILPGVEVTTSEEVHCLAFFPNFETMDIFQQYLDKHIANIKNDPEKFGYQVVVDADEVIIDEIETLLISAINQSIDQVEEEIHKLGGLFIPAHIDRAANGLISQLGFIPPDLKADAFEISKFVTYKEFSNQHKELKETSIIQSSDAHFIENIGDTFTLFQMENTTFEEVYKAIHNIDNRKIMLK